ncbi:alpha/beta fold hydrolase [Porticoccus sp.]
MTNFDNGSQASTISTKHVDVSGVRYAYRELGQANPADPTPVVFLQRFRGTLDDWDPGFVDAMARTRHVILFSDAGIGTSTGSAATSVDEKARNAADFVRALGYQSVDVLGFSMGGFVAQAIAMAEPTLVRKVVLVGTGAGGNPDNEPPTDIVFNIATQTEYSFEDIRYLFFAVGHEQETQAFIERVMARSEDLEPVVGPEVMDVMAQLIGDFMGGASGHYSRLNELRQPALIVSGDRDPFFPAKNHWVLYRELANAQLAMYPNAGHGPHQQHPQEVAAQIDYFLATA